MFMSGAKKNKSTQIKHYVEITEPIRSRETFDLDSIEPSESNNLTFNYHWVRWVAKPRKVFWWFKNFQHQKAVKNRCSS